MSALSATPNNDILTVAIRPVEDGDWAYITDSWEKSLLAAQRGSPSRGWMERVRLRIERLRERGAQFIVACDPENTTQILGWACVEPPVAHYVFVKLPFRMQGIARQLLACMAHQSVILCSEWTPAIKHIDATHPGVLRKVLPC